MSIRHYIILTFLIFLISRANGENINDIVFVNMNTISLYADLKGDSNKEKVVIKQTFNHNNSQDVKVTIQIYESSKIVFNQIENNEALCYAYVVRFPSVMKGFYRDFIFLVTESDVLRLNILCWEYNITEHDIGQKALSRGKYKFKGRYRFIKTGIQVSTPYG